MTNAYLCLPKQQFALDDYALRPLQRGDMEAIRCWRNEQIEVLRQDRPLTQEDQERYYREVVSPLFAEKQPPQLLFGYLLRGALIGYGGLVYVSWHDRRAEVSFLVDSVRAGELPMYRQDFAAFLELVKQVAFDALDLNRIFAETFDFRGDHIAVLEQAGFVKEGVMKEHIRLDDGFGDSVLHGYLRAYRNA